MLAPTTLGSVQGDSEATGWLDERGAASGDSQSFVKGEVAGRALRGQSRPLMEEMRRVLTGGDSSAPPRVPLADTGMPLLTLGTTP